MTRLRRPYPLLLVLLLAACTAGDPASAPAPSAPAPTPTGVRVAASVDIGGAEAYGLAVGDDAVWAVSYQTGALTRIDPATNAASPVALDGRAAVLLAAGGAVWAAGYGPGAKVWRVAPDGTADPGTAVPGDLCCDLAWDGTAVWAVDPAGAVFRVGGGPRHRVALDRNAHTNAVFAGGALWVSSDTTPLRAIDPANGRVLRTVDAGGGVPFLARDGLVWGAAPALIWAVDPRTGEVTRRIPIADSIEVLSLELAGDAIWVGIRRPGRVGAVLRLDAATGEVRDELREITIPARMAYGFGALWVTESGGSTVHRIATGS